MLNQQLKFGIAKITRPEVNLDCHSIRYWHPVSMKSKVGVRRWTGSSFAKIVGGG